jgi:hypothetical protein
VRIAHQPRVFLRDPAAHGQQCKRRPLQALLIHTCTRSPHPPRPLHRSRPAPKRTPPRLPPSTNTLHPSRHSNSGAAGEEALATYPRRCSMLAHMCTARIGANVVAGRQRRLGPGAVQPPGKRHPLAPLAASGIPWWVAFQRGQNPRATDPQHPQAILARFCQPGGQDDIPPTCPGGYRGALTQGCSFARHATSSQPSDDCI